MFAKVLIVAALVAYAQAGVFELQPQAHHASSYSSVNHHIAPVAHVAHVAPVAHVAHVAHLAPVAHVAHVGIAPAHHASSYSTVNNHISHAAPIGHLGQVAHVAHLAPVAHVAHVGIAPAHHASSYSSVNNHISHAAPIGHLGQVAHVAHVAPVAHYAHVAPVAHYAPVVKSVHQEVYADAHPHYSFEYGVKDAHTHDIKNQHEERDGDVVKGFYSLVQPDGVTRTVHYTADHHNGFNAQVDYKGHSAHPQQHVISAPVYHH